MYPIEDYQNREIVGKTDFMVFVKKHTLVRLHQMIVFYKTVPRHCNKNNFDRFLRFTALFSLYEKIKRFCEH
jgi:hypothetical protein